jgi:hypothetical protein
MIRRVVQAGAVKFDLIRFWQPIHTSLDVRTAAGLRPDHGRHPRLMFPAERFADLARQMH